MAPSTLRQAGNRHHEFGSWGSMASASITNVFSPMEKQSLAPVCVFLISGGGRQRRRAERDRNSSLFIRVSSPSPPRQPHLPLNILSPWVFFFITVCRYHDSMPSAKPKEPNGLKFSPLK